MKDNKPVTASDWSVCRVFSDCQPPRFDCFTPGSCFSSRRIKRLSSLFSFVAMGQCSFRMGLPKIHAILSIEAPPANLQGDVGFRQASCLCRPAQTLSLFQ